MQNRSSKTPAKYHVPVEEAPPRFAPVSEFSAIESEGCLGCLRCVKRDSCVYDVYRKRTFDPRQIVDTADVMCISCFRCVQECKKNILSRVRNPQFERMGDDYWKPDLIANIWKQATTGRIPVSGAGYDGPFAGRGFDEMWTDMSEIVRPTRDGIHGREYISTTIELGRRPPRLEFDAEGNLLTELPALAEISIPIVLDVPPLGFVGKSTRQAIAQAAGKLQTLAVASCEEAAGLLAEHRRHLIVKFDAKVDDPAGLEGIPIAELACGDKVLRSAERVKASQPGSVVSIRVPLDEHASDRASQLAAAGAEILHFQADYRGQGLGKRKNDFAAKLIKEVHFRLVDEAVREQLTIVVSGGIALAEHAAKMIICGADGVGVDLALLVALECRACLDCRQRSTCPVAIDRIPVDWGTQRIVNLLGSWHAQMIEVLGAMGLREVRRLRGELGRAMFFDDLERESFAPLFGHRVRSLADAYQGLPQEQLANDKPEPAAPREPDPAAERLVSRCPSRYRNRLGKYKVVRTSACIACGKCAEVCLYGVHKKAGKRMLAPKAHLCRGPAVCRAEGLFCGDHCPVGALRVGPNPLWRTFGDPRWTADLLVATWMQAETGFPPEQDIEYKLGASGGGFDRLRFRFPAEPPDPALKPEEIDLSLPLNRRGDGRPEVTIGLPIYGGGMSFGSISLTTMLARARAYGAYNSFTCTGEGGFPEELQQYDDHVITQVATGLFGVREETIQRVRMVEFKYAQGAKPGLGGHLLGDKVTAAVARMREAVEGSSLFSPFPFHSVYSVEDHKKHVDWIKHINPRALVSVKVSTPSDVDMVAVGSYYAGAHVIHLDGSYGGTGAAPDIAKKNIAMPIEYAIPKVHRFLQEEGIREEITLVASGGLRTAWDVAKAIALGANGVVIGTAELVALECIRCGVCESGRGCPRGIATTDPKLSANLDLEWATQRLINLFHSWVFQLREILWRLGLKSIGELVGRTDLLVHLDYDNTATAGPARDRSAVALEMEQAT
jgi:glutamate synthase domain-containing protein 2/Na+-translocating ferredoxin:NAD+ oxidoreductase RNF subunit RnfB